MTTNFPAVMDPNDLAVALGNSQVRETAAGGISFLKFDYKTGFWTLGRDQEDVTDDKILVNTPTFQHGWILWSGKRKTMSMARFNHPIPPVMDAIGADFPKEGRAFQGSMVDDGEPLSFDTSSGGGLEGCGILWGTITLHSAGKSKFLYPKVILTSSNYIDKNHGNQIVYKPVFKIIAWCDQDANEEPAAPAQIMDQSEPAPTRQRRKRRTKAEIAADAADAAPGNPVEPTSQQERLQESPHEEPEAPTTEEPPRRHRRQRSSAA